MNNIELLYEEISPLKNQDHAFLVLRKDTGRIYVKKYLEIYQTEIYQALAALQNLHIPRLYAWEEQGQKLCLIEEYIGGMTLMERMNGGILFSEEETVRIALQVCDALACLHSLTPPVIHRDIKLSNVMITDDGIVKLIDYNAARRYTEGTTQDTTLLGTADYAAPEQFGFAQTDARTDLYSLGVMMNYMLTGRSCKNSPCSGSGKLSRIIRRCTCLDPEKRYQTVLELKQALQKCPDSGRRRKTGFHRIPPLPGFRTGRLWKMMPATLGYLLLFSLCADLEIEGHETMPLVLLYWIRRHAKAKRLSVLSFKRGKKTALCFLPAFYFFGEHPLYFPFINCKCFSVPPYAMMVSEQIFAAAKSIRR